MNKRKHFAKKLKNEDFKIACIVKFLFQLTKILHKLANTIKFIESMKTMEILQDKSKLRERILLVKDVIIPAPNTMKSNATAS